MTLLLYSELILHCFPAMRKKSYHVTIPPHTQIYNHAPEINAFQIGIIPIRYIYITTNKKQYISMFLVDRHGFFIVPVAKHDKISKFFVFSSPEHNLLMVKYTDGPMTAVGSCQKFL